MILTWEPPVSKGEELQCQHTSRPSSSRFGVHQDTWSSDED